MGEYLILGEDATHSDVLFPKGNQFQNAVHVAYVLEIILALEHRFGLAVLRYVYRLLGFFDLFDYTGSPRGRWLA